MPLGPGKYDDICTTAREAARADGAILFIIRGEHGSGFSCQLPILNISGIPIILRDIANEIESALKEGKI